MQRNLVIIFLTVLAVSCKSRLPDYSDTPEISFKGFEIYKNKFNPLSLVYYDSVIVKLRFQDGDGDLGLDEDDKKNNTQPNFYMNSFVKKNGIFIDTTVYTGQFQPLSVLPKTIKGPIDGDLFYTVNFNYSDHIPNDSLKFFIFIIDRAGNQSNTVETDLLVVRQP